MLLAPADYPPPVTAHVEFIQPPGDDAVDRIEVGVVVVGGGPGGLSCAIRLMQLVNEDPDLAEILGEVPVALLEKGRGPGSHLLSGGIVRPSAIETLFPEKTPTDWPNYGPVRSESVYVMLNSRRSVRIPTPPPFRNHGNFVVSISELGRWLAEQTEQLGAYVLSESSATKLLVENGITVGVRTGDKGRGREGEALGNFEPGTDMVARATVLAEGTQGHLTGAAIQHFELGAPTSQRWEIGVKEVWDVERAPDGIVHTMGWPLRSAAKYREFGGGFLYPMGEDKVALGFVLGLDYRDASVSPHDLLQAFKTHPHIAGLLDGGRRVAWGAKTLPSGGYWALPTKLSTPGMCIVGDGAGMVNVPQLKGIHYAVHAGIFAAENIAAALKQSGTANDLSAYDTAVRSSVIGRELYRSRNMRQPFSRGFFIGGAIANVMEATGGRFPGGRWKSEPDTEVSIFSGTGDKVYPKPDGKLTFDKLSSVFVSGNQTRDSAPDHIRVQQHVPLVLARYWEKMCPAQVYEIPEDEAERIQNEGGGDRAKVTLDVTPSNCIQCGAISARGGRLTPPEGGDGPNYQQT